jgi:hypothetical protein
MKMRLGTPHSLFSFSFSVSFSFFSFSFIFSFGFGLVILHCSGWVSSTLPPFHVFSSVGSGMYASEGLPW